MASLRSPPARSQDDLGLYVGFVVLWGPAELGVVAGPRQLLGGLRAGVGLFPLCPHESPPAVLYSAQDSPRVRVGAVERDTKEAMKVLGGWSTSSMNKC